MKTCQFCAEDIQDAALVCKHCGRDLSTPTPVRKPRSGGLARLVLMVVAAILVLGFIGSLIEPSSKAFNATASGTNAELRLSNTGQRGWRAITVHLNGEFECVLRGPLGPGDSRAVDTADCTTSNGTRFSPLRQKVRRVQIEAIVGDGPSPSFKTLRFE